jgi:hypothetical protein
MTVHKASINIFQNESKYDSDNVPSEVFEAAKRVMENKNCELIRSNQGMYVIQYAEFGPFRTDALKKDWLPVYIIRIKQWSSGGLTLEEFRDFQK